MSKQIPLPDRSLPGHRLRTVTGPAGAGKSSYAKAMGLDPKYNYGCFYIDLAAVTDPALVARMTAMMLDVPLYPGEDPVELIAAAMRERKLSAVFDNIDHVRPAVAAMLETLLTRVPGFEANVATRAALGIPGERLEYLPGYGVPPPDSYDVRRFGDFESEAIYELVVVAYEVGVRIKLDARHAPRVCRLSRALDGGRLPIELAGSLTAKIKLETLSDEIETIASRAENGPRPSAKREMVMSRLLDWHYDLLSPGDQKILRRLAIFPGAFTADAAIHVVREQPPGPLEEFGQPLESIVRDLKSDPTEEPGADESRMIQYALLRLLRMNLIVPGAGTRVLGKDGKVAAFARVQRYCLPAPLRRYASELLEASGERDLLAERFAEHFDLFYQIARTAWEETDTGDWIGVFSRDIDNLYLAHEWALANRPGSELCERLAAEIDRTWLRVNQVAEAIQGPLSGKRQRPQ